MFIFLKVKGDDNTKLKREMLMVGSRLSSAVYISPEKSLFTFTSEGCVCVWYCIVVFVWGGVCRVITHSD